MPAMKKNLADPAFRVLASLVAGSRLFAQSGGQIIRLDPALDSLIPPDAKIEIVAGNLGFLEGPVWMHAAAPGFLIFSDIPANTIDKWNPADGKVSVFLTEERLRGRQSWRRRLPAE